MLYRIFNFISNWSQYTTADLLAVGIVLLGALLLVWFLPQLMRLVLAPLFLLELYFMSSGYACSGIGPLKRIEGTAMACSSYDYQKYLTLNFGIGQWYMLVTYALIVLFLIWPFLIRIVYPNGRSVASQAFKDSEKALEIERIRSLERKEEISTIYKSL